ncbi:MAG: glycosyltransferase family 4 protein [Desulfobulbaceae bacterium]|nr:glycosyltransferase family 4 protein [Desulfobulbaceae bacterium]
MNIAIEAQPLTASFNSGIPNYLKNIVLNLVRLDKENEYFLYWRDPFDFVEADNVHIRCENSRKKPLKSYGGSIWLFTRGVRMMKKDGIDLFWGPRHMLPPLISKKIKTVLTVHDLVWNYYPKTMELYNLLIMKLIANPSIKAADQIIAISEATAYSLQELLNVHPNKLTVIHNGTDGFVPLNKEQSAIYVAKKYGVSENYVLTLSTVEPRKNLKTLLKIAGENPTNFQILVAGASGWKTSSLLKEYKKIGLSEKQIKFLGYIPDEDMNRLYSGARLFLFPSLYEGFGLPPLEAMAAGTPVMVSNVSAMPEVVGEAGVLVDPLDVGAWKDNLLRLISDESLLEQMRTNGLERAKQFTWEKSARETLDVFRKVAGQ